TRALPVLTIVFLLEFSLALNADWRWWQNVLAAAGGFGLLLGLYAGVNRLRGLPAWTLPSRVGPPELATFVLLPAVVTAAFGQGRQAVQVVVANTVLVAAVYVVLSYGLVPLTRWTAARVFQQLGEVGGLLSRALPLLIVFVVFLFLTPEVWEVAGSMQWPVLVANAGLFLLLGMAFLLARLPTELGRLGEFDDVDAITGLCEGTPAAALTRRLDAVPETPRLNRRQRGNLYLVVLISQTVQIALVSATVVAFFTAFGLLAVRPVVQERWLGEPDASRPLVDFDLLGSPAALTPGLLRVAVFLGAFSGFYVAVYAVTDRAYREQFFDRVAGELRQTFAVRAAYLRALAR
ncbi:MAG TPA: hypothetical protein VFK43_03100, partial [Acidimicrobiales bacterium]|nr:hypothetical protein [Acidimicrobiales bacterium]